MRTESFAEDSIRIGAISTNDLVLEGEGVSRLHALVQRAIDGDGYIISDAGTASVRLNGMRVSRAKLRQGDRIQIGTFDVVVLSEQAIQDCEGSSDLGWAEPIYLLTRKKKRAV